MYVKLRQGDFNLKPWAGSGRGPDGPADFALLVPGIRSPIYEFLRERRISKLNPAMVQWRVASGAMVSEGQVIAEFLVPPVKSAYQEDKKAIIRAEVLARRDGTITIGTDEFAMWPEESTLLGEASDVVLHDPRNVFFAIQPTQRSAQYINVFSLYNAAYERLVKYVFSLPGVQHSPLHEQIEKLANASNGQMPILG